LHIKNTYKIFFVLSLFFVTYSFAEAKVKQICFKGNLCIEAEIADSLKEREKGLMFRDSLSDNKGMLFIFEQAGVHSFWMKNMRFPIDIIWMDEAGEVVYLSENVLPCGEKCEVLRPQLNVKQVLEVKAGFVKKHGIRLKNKVLLQP